MIKLSEFTTDFRNKLKSLQDLIVEDSNLERNYRRNHFNVSEGAGPK